MGLRKTAAIAASKITKTALRLLRRGGTTLPGKIAMKIYPEILGCVSKGMHCVIITGTNGKTTTARIVEEIYSQSKLDYIANRSGANLISGITTEFINNCSLGGRPKKSYAVIECDEAASREVCRQIAPELILVTNLFRDQLDRFGEVTNTLEHVLSGIKNAPNATVCINADDSLSVSISERIDNDLVFYGIDVPIYVNQLSESSDAPFCIHCKHEYEYSYRTFGHLGGFHCPNCGYKRPIPQVSVTEISELGLDATAVRAQVQGVEDDYVINLPGGYNIYNAAGALAVSSAMGLPPDATKRALAVFSGGFGRMERFDMGNTSARMILVKNPAGCNQALGFLGGLSGETLFVCALNDRIADGTDISWIWDAGFEILSEMGERLSSVYVAGVRRDDMALRLKYAGVPLAKIRIFDDYDELISAMSGQDKPVIIMPTYTAMMDLREKMSAAFGGGNFWD